MIVAAYDLATVAGYAVGRPADERPRSGSIVLKKPDQPQAVAFANLMAWLMQEWEALPPDLVVVERPYRLAAFKHATNSEASVRMAYGLHAIVSGMAHRYGIRFVDEEPVTIRKHFLGVSRLADREQTKRAVVARCHLLDYFPRTVTDDNRADACACWDWACSAIARKPPRVLTMYPPKPEPKSRRRKVA